MKTWKKKGKEDELKDRKEKKKGTRRWRQVLMEGEKGYREE